MAKRWFLLWKTTLLNFSDINLPWSSPYLFESFFSVSTLLKCWYFPSDFSSHLTNYHVFLKLQGPPIFCLHIYLRPFQTSLTNSTCTFKCFLDSTWTSYEHLRFSMVAYNSSSSPPHSLPICFSANSLQQQTVQLLPYPSQGGGGGAGRDEGLLSNKILNLNI